MPRAHNWDGGTTVKPDDEFTEGPEEATGLPDGWRLHWDEFEPDGELFASGCDLHIERMDDGSWWLGIYVPGKNDRISLWLTRKKTRVEAQWLNEL